MATMSGHVPVEINHMRQKGLVRVSWDDGHVGDYPREYLRGYCPCALCQGHGGEIKFIAAPNAQLAEISAVGNYAIQFGWGEAGFAQRGQVEAKAGHWSRVLRLAEVGGEEGRLDA